MTRPFRERKRELQDAEVPLFDPPRSGTFRVALAYPNHYFVGMSNLGFQSVYRMLNGHPGVVCERAFLPESDEAEEMERTGRPLLSFESGTEVGRFDVIAFSVLFENDILNVLRMLRMAGLPLRAAERGRSHPIVVFGGSAVFLNPEPLAPFADLIAAGEGEALIGPLLDGLLGAPDARRGVISLEPENGFYVPSRYEVRYDGEGRVIAYDGPGVVVRQRARPEGMPLPESAILTPHTEMAMKYMVEISRGCPCFCRFCWAGYAYLPVRGFSREALLARAREVRPVTRKIGLVSTAVADHPEIGAIVDDLTALDFEVSVASVRLDDLTPEFVSTLVRTGVQGLTIAPECGSDRLRCVLNKHFTNADILERATWIFESGVANLKLYYMVGLPGEEPADVEAIVELTDQVRARMLATGRGRGRIGRLHVSVNPYVTKPGTPFQWLPLEDPAATDRKLAILRRALGRMPNVSVVCKSARAGLQQSILAMGDRRLAPALELAVASGIDLKRAMREGGLDGLSTLFRTRGRDELFPWDIIDNGVAKSYLLQELDRSQAGRASPPCPKVDGCSRCGVCAEKTSAVHCGT